MRKDKEPEQLASIALSREEIASRQRVVGKPRTTQSTQSGAPKLMWGLIVIILCICGGLGFQFYEFKKQSDLQLAALTILQEKLTSTDEQANLSVDAMKILLKEQDHEIRKLWDLSNKRNKVNISKNKTKINEQGKLVNKQAKEIKSISKEVGQLEDSVNKKVADKLDAANKEIKQVKSDTLLLEAKLDKSLSAFPKDVSKTLDEHSKGIKAMDATRLQLMRRIQDLEKQIDALKAPVAKSPAQP